MTINEKVGNINSMDLNGLCIDYLEVEWYETAKRILHKRTNAGKEVVLKFLNQNQNLTEGDILYRNDQEAILVNIKPCDSIVIKPLTMYEMAFVCYEIGNKHLPLFYDNDELIIPYEAPIFKMLEASGLHPEIQCRKLLNQLRTSVSAHSHTGNKSLLSKILQLTSPNE